MKAIFKRTENEVTKSNESNTVSESFVAELLEAFTKFPKTTVMRYRQINKKLFISLLVTYRTGVQQHFEGYGDADLITAIINAQAKIFESLSSYKANEHTIDEAKEDENLVLTIFNQLLSAKKSFYIDRDWFSPEGTKFRNLTFTLGYNIHAKFCLKATEEVNKLITESCKPDWMKEEEAKAEADMETEKA